MLKIRYSLLFPLFLLIIVPQVVYSQVLIIDRPASSDIIHSLPIRSHEVNTSIQDQVATTHIKQVFYNPNKRQMEGRYILAIPSNSSISKFTLEIDGKQVEAETLKKEKAEKIYQDIVNQMRDPGILSFSGKNMIQAKVFPIEAEKTKTIEIQYEEILDFDNGTSRYEYNLATNKICKQPIDFIKIEVDLKSKIPLKNIYSPSHDINVKRSKDTVASIKYSDENVTPEDNFLLFFSQSDDPIGLNVFTYKEKDEDGFFLFLAAPELAKPDKVTPKDIIFVFDQSGSMRTDNKIDQAKDALTYCLKNLNPEDRFAVITFNDVVDPLTKKLISVESDEKDDVLQEIDKMDATGGTNIIGALEKAFQLSEDNERPTYLLFLTDGLPTVGERDENVILQHASDWNKHQTRVFTFGVGFDVNTLLLDELSQENKGMATYVKPNQEIEAEVSSLYSKIASPVLANLSIETGSIETSYIYPQELPDLFSGSQLVVLGKYENGGSEIITLKGTANGKEKEFSDEFVFTKQDTTMESIPRLWAARRIGFLMAEIRKQGENKELVQEVIDLSQKYGILTEYTSFLVTESPVASAPISEEEVREQKNETLNRAFFSFDRSLGQTSGRESVAVSEVMQDQLQNADSLSVQNKSVQYNVEGVKVQNRIEGVRFAGNQAFFNRDNAWISTAFDANQKVLQVKPFSKAYFQLANASKEISQILALGTNVSFIRNDMMIQIDEKGIEELTEEQIEQLK